MDGEEWIKIPVAENTAKTSAIRQVRVPEYHLPLNPASDAQEIIVVLIVTQFSMFREAFAATVLSTGFHKRYS